MRLSSIPIFVAGAVAASLLTSVAGLAPAQDPQRAAPPSAADMQAMMEQAKRYTEPGEHHQVLSRFVGKWDMELRLFMAGEPTPPTTGTSEFSWVMEGRWLQQRSTGSVMGQPLEMFSLFGYDNFKQSYIVASVSSMDTAMVHSEGDMDPSGKAILLYGTVDEYLTGEHDKMVKAVWRLISEDELVLEIHDLPIGEHNTKVFEMRYRRAE